MPRTVIIAEAGVNHNGNLDLACRLIDVAAECGADFVKFQTFDADRLVTAHAGKAEYQQQTTAPHETQHAMLKQLELSPAMHRILLARCRERGVGFLSTGFDTESIDFLIQLGIDRVKIPSGEITNLPYLRHVGRIGKPVIMSTGMATLEEVGAALQVLETAGTPRASITVLHCTTEYPTPMAHVNLRAMQVLRDTFNVAVGYSDHSKGIEVPIAAVALGATVIEKHFTLDRALPGPDHEASLTPDELRAMVSAIRNIESALGDGVKRPSAGEEKNMSVARKSLVASRPIQAGEFFSEHNVTAKRPGTGVSPMRWDEVIGRQAPRTFMRDELIEL
ncbi:MAG: N-acetylneuraminate synthase [Nitrospira sp.]|jgi:N,N'-diacetyllegionaminate synthase|nr:N-acetylneuraminate synthase [Nitrospira sp. BO4]